jgi:pimeloyl-ACP methyl ester carboxylesterase
VQLRGTVIASKRFHEGRMSLYARELGSGGTPIILLHGFGGDHTAWHAIQPELAAGSTTIAYDLPGHGRSLAYPGAGSAKTAANAIIADLAERGVERAHLVGHSMGGAIASLIGLFDPARVASLTLLAPGGFGSEINHRLLTRYAAASTGEQLAQCLESMTGWYSPVSDDVVARTLKARSIPGQRDLLIEMAKGLAKDGRQGQLPLDKVAALHIPVSVAWGDLDNVLPVRQAENLPASFAVRRFDNLGHMLPEEAPETMAQIIRETCGF